MKNIKLFQKLLAPFIRRKIIKSAKEWNEKTIDWGPEEWRNYQIEKFEKLKGNRWTSQVFPDLKNYDYDGLLEYPMTTDYPEFPPEFPAYRIIHTTGTTRRKIVKFTVEDAFMNAITIGRFLFRNLEPEDYERALFIAGERDYVSGLGAEIFKIYNKKGIVLYANEFLDKLDYIMKKGPFNFLFAAQIIAMSLAERLTDKAFDEQLIYIHTGDILYDSFREYLTEKMKGLGVERLYFVDLYGASEIPLTGVSHDFWNGIFDLEPVPDTSIAIIEKENGERVNLLDARVGDRGRILFTPLYSLMIPNYRLGDVIEVTGHGRNGLPLYKVLGRDLHKVKLKHPSLGIIEGYTGAMFKIMAVPFNTYAFDRVMSKIKTRYLALVKKEGTKGLIEVYTEKNVEKEALIAQFKAESDLYPLYEGILMGKIDVEVQQMNMSYLEIFVENWRGGHLKVPRVITEYKLIESRVPASQ